MSDYAGTGNPVVAETARPLFSSSSLSNRVDRLIKQIRCLKRMTVTKNIIQRNGKNIVESLDSDRHRENTF